MYDEIENSSNNQYQKQIENLQDTIVVANYARNNVAAIAILSLGQTWWEKIRNGSGIDNPVALTSVINILSTIPTSGISEPQKLTAIKASLDSLQLSSRNSLNSLQETITKAQDVKNVASTTFELGTLQTLSIQSHREKNPVRALGTSYVKGYTRGQRTIAGSMIFTLFDEHALAALIRAMNHDTAKRYGEMYDTDLSSLMIDQLPPIDLTILFCNEYGAMSKMSLYGVEFINNGMTLSIEDILTEEVVNWVARDIDEMVRIEDRPFIQTQRGIQYNSNQKDKTGSNLLVGNRNSYNEFLKKIGVRRRLTGL
jgi:hypothetical protein